MNTRLIRNALLINEGQEFTADVLIENGRISRIEKGGIQNWNGAAIDATGLLLIPGAIDDQVHFREPGLTHKGCIATESAAAVAGGITSVMDMPNTKPPTLSIMIIDSTKSGQQWPRAAVIAVMMILTLLAVAFAAIGAAYRRRG